MFIALERDVDACARHVNGPRQEFWRRMYTRAVFTFMEGMGEFLKYLCLRSELKKPKAEQDHQLIAALRGMSIKVSDQGDIREVQERPRTLHIWQLAVKQSARLLRSSFELDKADVGWNAVMSAKKIRDRVTHPKTLSDLFIADAELIIIRNAYFYIKSVFTRLLQSVEWPDGPVGSSRTPLPDREALN